MVNWDAKTGESFTLNIIGINGKVVKGFGIISRGLNKVVQFTS
jgi:hypothetical protein